MHVVALAPTSPPSPSSSVVLAGEESHRVPESPEFYYRLYFPIVQQAIHRLMVPNLNDLSERRVVVVYDWSDAGLVLPVNAREAVLRILLAEHRFRAAAFVPAVEMIPFAFPPQIGELMVVQLSSCVVGGGAGAIEGVHCMAFASHEPLEYTYQSSSWLRRGDANDPNRIHRLSKDDPFTDIGGGYNDDDNSESVVIAILKCLEACPREIRRGVVSNLVVAGRGCVTGGPRSAAVRIARRVRAYLRGGQQGGGSGEEEAARGDSENVAPQKQLQESQRRHPAAVQFTRVPVRISELSCLSGSVGIVEIPSIRPDLLGWVGASAWGSHWHGVDPDSKCFRWTTTTTTPTTRAR